jgi:hypothetical protein
LQKKEAELQLIKERAEWDKREREALESLKMALESEKRKVEDELEGERALGLDKDALLERSKRREVELEEEVAALQAEDPERKRGEERDVTFGVRSGGRSFSAIREPATRMGKERNGTHGTYSCCSAGDGGASW